MLIPLYQPLEVFKSICRLNNVVLPPVVSIVTIGSPLQDSAAGSIVGEVCCGTHVTQLGDLEDLVVTEASGMNQAVKKLECVVGERESKACEEAAH